VRVEVVPAVAAVVEAPGAPPPPVLSATVVEGQTNAGEAAPQPAPEPPTEAGLSGGDVVVVLDEDSVPPPSLGVAMSRWPQ
jgi:hypothetical protein